MKQQISDIISAITDLNLTKFQLKDVVVLLPTKLSSIEFLGALGKCDFFINAILPKVVSIKNSVGGITKLEKISILTKILKKKFGNLEYSGVLEYAKDFSMFISDYYSYSLDLDTLKKNADEYNNLDEIVDIIELYELATNILQKQDSVIVAKYSLDQLLKTAKHVVMVGLDNIPTGYRNVINKYKDKVIRDIAKISDMDIGDKVEYCEFNSDMEKAKFIAFKIFQIVNDNSNVMVISNDGNLSNLIAILLKKYGVYPYINNDDFLKTNFYNFIIESANVIKSKKIVDLVALLKNDLSTVDAVQVEKFEYLIRRNTFVGEDFINIVKRFLESNDECIDDDISIKFSDLLCRIVEEIPRVQNFQKAEFLEWAEYHKRFINLVLDNTHKHQINLYFNFITSGTKGILSDCVDFDEYINLLKKISALYEIDTEKKYDCKVRVLNFASAKLLSVDYVIFASVNDQIFPNTIYNNYWINKSLREQLGIKDDIDYKDLYSIIDSTKTRCFIFHSTANDKKRAHIIDELFVKYPNIKLCDTSDYHSYNSQFNNFIKVKFANNIQTPKLPSPNPSQRLRPITFSATDIGFLVKNPYKVYVKHILKLNELNFFDIGLDNIRKGNIVHEVMQRLFSKENVDIHSIVGDDFKLWLYNIESLYKYFHEEIQNFTNNYTRSLTEISGKMYLDKFTIKVRADRLDLFSDGSFGIIDYKTGTLPSKASVIKMINPQMLVEALVFLNDEARLKNFDKIRYIKFVKLSKNTEELIISEDINVIKSLIRNAEIKLSEILQNSLNNPYRAYLKKYTNMESDPVFKLSRAHEIFH